MKVTFIASSGLKFIVTGQPTERESRVTTDYVASTGDLEEYVAWVKEEREAMERGPVAVPSSAKLVLNGTKMDIVYNPLIPRGSAYYVDEEGRITVLEEGAPSTLAKGAKLRGG